MACGNALKYSISGMRSMRASIRAFYKAILELLAMHQAVLGVSIADSSAGMAWHLRNL